MFFKEFLNSCKSKSSEEKVCGGGWGGVGGERNVET